MISSENRFFDNSKTMQVPSKYSINLAWLNRTLNTEQRYVYPCATQDELIDKFLGIALKWQDANSEACVSVWYDSCYTSIDAIRSTLDVLKNDPRFSKIKLRDIRDIPIVKNNPDAFSDRVPIYVRVDLIKLIICVFCLENENNDASIFSDLYIGVLRPEKDRMNKNELFNSTVMKQLNLLGLVLGIDAIRNVENQFIQVLNKPETLTALKLTIDASFLRIITTLNLARTTNDDYMMRHLSSGTVFCALKYHTPNLIYGLLSQKDEGKTKINLQVFNRNDNPEWVEYEPMKHGCIPLGNFYNGAHSCDFLQLSEQDNTHELLSIEKFIKLPYVPPTNELGRDDMDTFAGRAHDAGFNFIKREPVNGEEYICDFMIPPAQINPTAKNTL